MKNWQKALSIIAVLVVAFGAWWLWRWEKPAEDLNRATIEDVSSDETAVTPDDTVADDTPTDGVPRLRLTKAEGRLSAEVQNSEVTIDTEKSFFRFTGYAVGKSHEGSFDEMGAEVLLKQGGVGAGTLTIQADSVNTAIGGLDSHLLKEEFFDVEQFPTITFNGTVEAATSEISGALTFRGVTKNLTFPATISENSLEIDTVINVREFGISYVGVNDEVRIEAGLFWN